MAARRRRRVSAAAGLAPLREGSQTRHGVLSVDELVDLVLLAHDDELVVAVHGQFLGTVFEFLARRLDADQLADTTMDPRTRMLRRIRMEDAAQASEIFSLLMGDDVPPRKQFIVDNADDFDRSKIDT